MKQTDSRWTSPMGGVPAGWIERQAVINEDWFIKVWLSASGVFECTVVCMIDGQVWREPLKATALDEACLEAEQVYSGIIQQGAAA